MNGDSHPAFTTKSIHQANFAGIMACLSLTTDSKWIIDTGASDHMCFDQSLFTNIQLLIKPFPIFFTKWYFSSYV